MKKKVIIILIVFFVVCAIIGIIAYKTLNFREIKDTETVSKSPKGEYDLISNKITSDAIKIEENKQEETKNDNVPEDNKEEEKTNNEEQKNENTTIENSNSTENKENNNYIGKEEEKPNQENSSGSIEEKVIKFAKEKWGAEDDSVTYSITSNNDTKYFVAVSNKDTTSVLAWYVVDSETWVVEEY